MNQEGKVTVRGILDGKTQIKADLGHSTFPNPDLRLKFNRAYRTLELFIEVGIGKGIEWLKWGNTSAAETNRTVEGVEAIVFNETPNDRAALCLLWYIKRFGLFPIHLLITLFTIGKTFFLEFYIFFLKLRLLFCTFSQLFLANDYCILKKQNSLMKDRIDGEFGKKEGDNIE